MQIFCNIKNFIMRYYLASFFFHLAILFCVLHFSQSQNRSAIIQNKHMFVEMITLPRSQSKNAPGKKSKKAIPKQNVTKAKPPIEPKDKKESKTSRTSLQKSSEDNRRFAERNGRDHAEQVNLDYAQELKLFLEKNKHYPRQALRLKQSGVVVVRLKIDASGKFLNIEIEKPSSFPILNNAAEDLLRKLGGFKPPPSSLASVSDFTIPIAYISRRM